MMWNYRFWLGVASCVSGPIRLQNSLINDILGKNQLISYFFTWNYSSREVSIFDYLFWLEVACRASCPIKLQHSLIINILGKSQLISKFFCVVIIIKGRLHLRLQPLIGCGQVRLWSSQIIGFFDNISGKIQLIS